MRHLTLIFLGLLWAGPGFAAAVSERPDKVTITIYQPETLNTVDITKPSDAVHYRSDGIAFITESRSMDLPAGPVQIEFRGVTSTIVPQTAEITGLPSGVLERNFDFDLLSPGSLLAKSIGQTVRLERTDPKTGKRTEQSAIVRAAPLGVVLEISGKFEALHCSGLPERLVFDRTPNGLRDTPTLSVRAVMPRAGRYKMTLSYIATGLFWSADYNAHIRPDGRSLDLNGWITLTNLSDSNYRRVPVEFVAGRVFTAYVDEPVAPQTPKLNNDCWPTEIDWATLRRVMDKFSGLPPPPPPPPPSPASADKSVETVVVTGSRIPDPRQLGDYKLYRLPELTDVASHQSKQVQFLDQVNVPFERLYTYYVDPYNHDSEDVAASAVLRLHNTEAGGLGKPLPTGTVSVMEPASDGSPVLAGQQDIRDTPAGLPFEIETGRAIDVRVQRRETDVQTSGSGKNKLTRTTYDIVIENDKSTPIRFELAHPLSEGARLIAEDQSHAVEPNGMFWSFALSPGERKTMHYTIEAPES